MKHIQIKGNSLNEIISAFRKDHKIKDWELQYEVISNPSNGLFGLFGKKKAEIRFNLLSTEERVKLFIEQLLTQMELRFDSIESRTDHKTVYINIHNSSDAGFLIGKNGNMLEQLQYLVNRVFENVQGLERIYLDTEDYRLRQEQIFIRSFIPAFNKVKNTGKPITLEPMSAGDRRIIHKYVEGEPLLKTLTVGEGEYKRVTIMPVVQKETEPRAQKPQQTPQQRATQSYNRHNQANPKSRPSQRPRREKKERVSAE